MAVMLCDLAMISSPHTVLRKGLAEHCALASEAQARGRGSPPTPDAVQRRLYKRQSACPIKARGAGIMGPRRTSAFKDAALLGFTAVLCRLLPAVSRSAPGSPALLPEVRRNCSRANAVLRLRLTETARASLCARLLRAVPLAGFFSNVARDFGPGSFPRRKRVAASAKAHVRWAWPILCPEVPKRFPADAFAHWMRRQYDAKSCPRGKRSIWCMSSSKTRRRMLPMPGTVCHTDRGWASWCLAVLRIKRSRSLRLWS